MNSEKKSQELLSAEFDGELCYATDEEPMMSICAKCSCRETGNRGFPDAWYIQDKTLLIFECKRDDLNAAKKQLLHYRKTMQNLDQFDSVYFIAYSGTQQISRQILVFDLEGYVKEMPEIKLKHFGFKKVFQIKNKEEQMKEIQTVAHKIHNIIRDSTKLSNEDKPLFIGSILLGIQIPAFRELISTKDLDEKKLNGKQLSQILIDKIQETYEEKIITNSIQFLKETFDNAILFAISRMTLLIYEGNKDCDVLNIFYTEFCKYQNTDSSSLGIVLTPDHIVRLMIQLLELKPTDVFLDLCTGTGSFLKEASKTCQVIGCEYQNKLAALAKINMILIGKKENKIFHSDCFKCEALNGYKFTKSAINPPYGGKGEIKEIKFIEKQIELIQPGGLCCAIVPENIFNASREKDKKVIFESCQILRIIKCNPKLFYPTADVQCCIILLRKQTGIHETCLQDYTDEKFKEKEIGSRKKVYLCEQDFNQQYQKIMSFDKSVTQKRVLKIDEDWKQTQKSFSLGDVQNHLLLLRVQQKSQKMINDLEMEKNKCLRQLDSKPRTLKISDLFERVKGPKRSIEDNPDFEDGFPLISARKVNNGITKYIQEWDYDGDAEPLFTISNGNIGNIGFCFRQKGKFSIVGTVFLVRLKIQMFEGFEEIVTANLDLIYQNIKNTNWDHISDQVIQFYDDFEDTQIIENHFNGLQKLRLQTIQKEYIKECFMNRFVKGYSYPISDLFEYVGTGHLDSNKAEEGEYPLICASKEQNGVLMNVSEWKFEGPLMTCPISGAGAGCCFVQEGKFNTNQCILVLKLKLEMPIKEYKQLAQYITIQLNSKYDYIHKLSKDLFMNETIQLPWLLTEQIEEIKINPPKREIKLDLLTKDQLLAFIEREDIGPVKKSLSKKALIEYIIAQYTNDSGVMNEKGLQEDLNK